MNRAHHSPTVSVRGLVAAAAGVALALVLGSCATPRAPEATKLVWPPPPLPPRIEFVRAIVSDEDLEKDTTFQQKLLEFATGEKIEKNRLVEPIGVAVSEDTHRLYVSDNTQRAVFVFDFEKKKFSRIDNLNEPVAIALDARENLYVSQPGKKLVAVFGRDGKDIGKITDPSLERPTGLAVDNQRNRLYVVDTGTNNTHDFSVKIFALDTRKVIGRVGKGEGPKEGQFVFPTHAAVDGRGHLYVTDSYNHRVQEFDEDGKFVRGYGSQGDGWGHFDRPKGVALDTFGNLYVVDSTWSNVQIFNSRGDVLLFFGGRGPIPGMLKNPAGIAIDKRNRIYVANYLNHRIDVYDLVNTTAADSFIVPPSQNPVGKGMKPAPK